LVVRLPGTRFCLAINIIVLNEHNNCIWSQG
jgi:hypothetical protein